jgi:hypothetical protein
MTKDNVDDDRVGYCKPPKRTRFRPGQSGNPRGRTHREAYEETENPLRMYMLEQMKVSIKGKKVKMTAVDLIIKSMINKAVAGCHKTQKLLIQESGGLRALREEYKRQKTKADEEFIEQILKKADEWVA